MSPWWLILAAILSFAVTAGLGLILIPLLRKLNINQPIKQNGPVWHQSKPTMGGLLFIPGILIALALAAVFSGGMETTKGPDSVYHVWIGVGMALLFGVTGLLDDLVKVRRNHNDGLSPRQKLLLQALIAIAFLLALDMAGIGTTTLWIPFLGLYDLGYFYYPLMVFIIVAEVNAVNLTDGIDGLCGSVTLVAAAFFALLAGLYTLSGLGLMAMALIGGVSGFLVWNFRPAKVIMGDLGSHFLGGLIVALAFYIDKPLLLLPVGIVYFLMVMSVVLQIISFKTTGKRIFKMSPVHHHLEMSGWSEVRICGVFTAVGILGAFIAYMLEIFG